MKDNEMGALWRREDKNGNTYYSGVVKTDEAAYEVVMFQNNYKNKDNQPDLRILRRSNKPEQTEEVKSGEAKQGDYSKGIEYPQEDINPDDIPF